MPLGPINVHNKGTSISLDEDQLRKTFMRFDVDGNKILSKDEIKKAFEHLGSVIPGFRASRSLRFADSNNDGNINMDELDGLVKYAKKLGFYVK